MRGDGAERRIAHAVQEIVVHHVAGADHPDAGETALGICFMKLPPCPAGTNTNIASGLESFIRAGTARKSGLARGT